ncbi:MAG: penicillin acylase family protein, partial [Deltaproteobacteria bacterium]|nr:penicillin acylase family protein [Deltaproteobacteria bacterium]
AGEKARALDVRMRTLGFHRFGEKHASILGEDTLRHFRRYMEGVNAYIRSGAKTFPLEFKLAGIQPKPWTAADSLAVGYYMSWASSANIRTEIVAQMLVEKLGMEKALEIFPLNVNPDDKGEKRAENWKKPIAFEKIGLTGDVAEMSFPYATGFQIGSNNWAVGPESSTGGKPIVANDPHLDARMLPGPWYPCGIITPEHRIVGVTVPGTPVFAVFRNADVAVGVTNAYGDSQDLYVETLDPDDPGRYMEGDRSYPFEVVEETLKIKDKKASDGFRTEKVVIRYTHRGPVVSNVLSGLNTDRVLTLRWAPYETMGESMGLEQVVLARSVEDIRKGIENVNWIGLNFVFADKAGNIGWHASGRLPIRSQGEATVPYVVGDGSDNWIDWIPFDKMPHSANPARGWVGTCNHKTVTADYAYYYSSHMSPSYRYRRLIELLDAEGKKSPEDHWRFQRDTLNLMAREIAPVMARALLDGEDTEAMGKILSEWDFKDRPEAAAPAVFQTVYRQFALLVFGDELGEDLANTMLNNWYFWQERLQEMVVEGSSEWFDNVETAGVVETRDDLFRRAALEMTAKLGPTLGKDPRKWQWGKLHQLEFVSPVRRKGFGKGWLGGGSHPMGGSGETLYRGLYKFNKPYMPAITASMRMVADLADDDKVMAVMPSGVTGRVFWPHTTDQIEAFM